MTTQTENNFQALNGNLQEPLTYEQQLSRRQHAPAGDTFNLVTKSFLITLAIAIALSILVNLFMARLITRPLMQTVGVIQEIAERDLTQEIRVDTKDEIGNLARAVDGRSGRTLRSHISDPVRFGLTAGLFAGRDLLIH